MATNKKQMREDALGEYRRMITKRIQAGYLSDKMRVDMDTIEDQMLGKLGIDPKILLDMWKEEEAAASAGQEI